MSKSFLGQMYNYFGFACICLMGIVFESEAEKPTAIIMMLLTGAVSSAFYSECKKEGE